MTPRPTLKSFLVLLVASVVWFLPELLATAPGADEVAYFQGFDFSMRGLSPYDAPRFLYPPVFARLGAFLLERSGFFATAVGLRFVNLAAATALAWGAFAAVPSLGRARLPFAALALVAFRPLTTAVSLGNLSPLAAVATFAGVLAAAPAPLLAGLVLATGFAFKPAGLPALLLLPAHRPGGRSWRPLVAAGVALAASGLLLTVDARLLPTMLGRSDVLDASTNLALRRVLGASGVAVPALVVAAIVIVPCAAWIRARSVGPTELVAIVGLAAVLWPPRVWLHSFAFLLPAVALAMGNAVEALRASRRFESERGPAAARGMRQRAALTATWTLLGVVVVELADALGDLGTAVPFLPWNPALNAAIPLVAATLLTLAAVRGTGQ